MKNLYLRLVFLLGICFILTACTSRDNNQLPDPQIKMGTAKLTGIIKDFHLEEGKERPIAYINFNKIITGERGNYSMQVNDSGKFTFQIPLELSPTIASLNLSDEYYILTLDANKESCIEIVYDGKAPGKINILKGPDLITNNTKDWDQLLDKVFLLDPEVKYKHINRDSVNRFIQNPREYIPYAMKYDFGKRLELIENDTIIPEKEKKFLQNLFNLMFAEQFFFYQETMEHLFEITRSKEDTSKYVPTLPTPDKLYYDFLKKYELNKPCYLYHSEYFTLLQTILFDKALNLPKIEDTPIDQWLENVKETLAELVGFDSGLFYDMLIATAYIKQFKDELRPLSDKQQENIKNYFKGNDIEKILLDKNEEIVEFAKGKHTLNIQETPKVAKEKVLDAIVANYKDKVVVIDFWATWCPPCLMAMDESRELKKNLKGKDVVFVYITNPSSPKELWEEKIVGIGGEQYYITTEEWDHIFETLDMSGIPAYHIYDSNGRLKEKITGYPGNNQMQEEIEKLLP